MNGVPQTVMILAAGLGTRMRPLTDDRPKPLVEVAGHTLIDHTLGLLKAEGVKCVIVNLHYKADMLRQHLARHDHGLDILFSDETDRLLDSGGGIKKALPLFGTQDPIISVNGDLLWAANTGIITRAWQAYNPDRMDALLMGAPVDRATGYDGPGDLFFTQTQEAEPADLRAQQVPAPASAPYYFCGVQILARRMFDGFAAGEPFSVKQAWTNARQRGKLFALGTDMPTYHIGTPAGRDEADKAIGGS